MRSVFLFIGSIEENNMSGLFGKIAVVVCAVTIMCSALLPCVSAQAEAPENTEVPVEITEQSVFEISAERDAGERKTIFLDPVFEKKEDHKYTAEVAITGLTEVDVVLLELPATSYEYTVYVNGELIAERTAAFAGETVNITAYGERITVDIITDGAEFTGGASLTVSGQLYVQSVKTSYDIEAGLLNITATVHNYSDRGLAGALEVTVYELGTVVDGVSSVRNGTGFVSRKFDTAAGVTRVISDITVSLRSFGETKYWSPENPYLYEIVLKTGSDSESIRIGMRDFSVNEEEKNIELNGNAFFVSGITVNLADEEIAANAGNSAWIKNLFDKMKYGGLTTVKCISGVLPEVWYSLADENGILLISEYDAGRRADEAGKTAEELCEEYFAVMDLLYNHPSAVMWDVSGGAEDGGIVEKIASAAVDYDVQRRPFDCGFSTAPVSGGDIIECDVSLLGEDFSLTGVEMTPVDAKINYYPEDLGWDIKDYANPKILSGFALGDYSEKELARLTEYLRVQRIFSGMLIPIAVFSGETDDNAADALNPIGLAIEYYSENNGRGDVLAFDVALLNDTRQEIENIDVTVVLRVDGDELFSETKEYDSVMKYGTDGRDIARRKFNITVPAYITDNTEAVLEARFTIDGRTVKSSRTVMISGGVAYETPYSTLLVVSAVSVCALIITTACFIALGRMRNNANKNRHRNRKRKVHDVRN